MYLLVDCLEEGSPSLVDRLVGVLVDTGQSPVLRIAALSGSASLALEGRHQGLDVVVLFGVGLPGAWHDQDPSTAASSTAGLYAHKIPGSIVLRESGSKGRLAGQTMTVSMATECRWTAARSWGHLVAKAAGRTSQQDIPLARWLSRWSAVHRLAFLCRGRTQVLLPQSLIILIAQQGRRLILLGQSIGHSATG